MRCADQPRGDNRAQINRLFEGFPPWTQEEVKSAQIACNVNFLDAPKLAADARRSYYNAFLKPRNYFSLTLRDGPMRSRASWSAIVTSEINRIMKDSVLFMKRQYNLWVVLAVLEEYMKVSGIKADHKLEGTRKHVFIIQHELGENWSLFTKELLALIFQNLANVRAEISTTSNTTVAEVVLR